MPMIEVTAPEGALDQAARDTLMKRATEALLTREGAPLDNPVILANAWSYYQEVPMAGFYVGGSPAKTPKFKFKITTPQGVLTDESRAGLVADIGKIVEEVIGPTGAGANHWVHLREIKDGGWGTAGRIVKLADIRAASRGKAG
ncbi:tautomerase family protein [Bradyrhizobium sp. USDA 4502]